MKILLVDDEESILNLVKMNLMFENYDVVTAECGKDAIKLFQSESPDLIVLDLMLPDMDGFQIIHEIQNINSEIPIIVLSAKNQINDRLLGLQLGADDYITKPFDSRELILRIRAISRRINKVKLTTNKETKKIIEKGFIKIMVLERRVFINLKEVNFTHIEFEILVLMVQNAYKVFTREELLDKIWGYDFSGNTRAVDIHIKRIRKKLLNHEEAIKTIYGVGYRFEV
ncbi:response regulator transcription factor [Clostridium botulinum]|uniref:Stage 0 sporulation protein A homolog n=1 Tax=Clostridium botulinum C/D str. DC5 TaxID=1443128 RepID=A0A0A0IIH8_CLOBO|nr:response regulator transcription factor [Clostridium botulinum]KEI06927.1 XRE family transcriptional regulator [Clostridium botulinum C/D str. BKT75002]KEI08223.1 XRE family transcriptional regulator [Clostridium botulinum C/D str. BKT2873]KGM95738.1 XRE family transcriptional regulator [Clostridium botulinum D str. CCUG 7971]KGN00419.1 XRE family transcriptional regulator [Clostridium botulinum C/D str. DC5]KOC48015.1 XRE family transcriptional regulator [Clostridium botulinum]